MASGGERAEGEMYKKLLFRPWWRLAVSAILPFLLIGGMFISKEGWRYDHFLVEAFAGWIVLSIVFFLILTSISLYISEKVVGWKRLSIVVASGLGIISFLITLISWSSLRGDEAAVALLISCAAFPIGVLLVLGGRFTTKWVRAGFSDPAEPITRSSAGQKRDFSSAEENSAPHLTSISTDTDIPISERDKIIAMPLAGPWRRFWARIIDMSLFGLPISLGIAIAMIAIDPAFESWLQNAGSNYVFSWLCLPAVLLAEAIVFGVFGNTPGKALLGLRVATVGGSEPSFNHYLSRLFGVYWFGLGTGFPIVSLFTMLKQFQRLKLGRETYYDSGRFNVRGYQLGFFRIAIAAAVVFLLLVMVPGILTELARGRIS